MVDRSDTDNPLPLPPGALPGSTLHGTEGLPGDGHLIGALDFARLARRRLPAHASRNAPNGTATSPSDYDLNPGFRPAAGIVYRPAAVLVTIIARDQPTLLLTRRADHLARHAGQIAFPGGRIDDTDAGPVAAALREAEEEIGLPPAMVEPLGQLSTYLTATGYAIVPVVGLVAPDFEPTLAADEVAEAFEVPLAFIMDPANHRTHSREWNGTERRYHAIPFGPHYIWGATAGILKNMHERLFLP